MSFMVDCVEPNKDNKFNFAFDTNILEVKLSTNSGIVKKCQSRLSDGYRYFVSAVQPRELEGCPDRKGTYNDLLTWHPSKNQEEIKSIIQALNIKRISCVSILRQDFICLDGTFRYMYEASSADPLAKMFFQICDYNERYINDAVIAEAAIYNDCNLVSADGRLIKIVKKYFPGRAFLYDEFIAEFLS